MKKPKSVVCCFTPGAVFDFRYVSDETAVVLAAFRAPDLSHGAEFTACLHQEEATWNKTYKFNQKLGGWRQDTTV